ncbi:MAG: hypothetical protein DI635_14945 [Pseudoxanthomonas suwonensis]|nr:MAG: hypothetical protein DI635_14945 [Pseudoxanthomonas suwonensis]
MIQPMRTFTSFEQVRTAIEDGSFDENHYLEAKQVLKTKTTKDKNELALDLAQFAFDGGTVVFGVAESKDVADGGFSMTPIPLSSGVREQIEQIAQERCQPALPVRVTTLPEADGAKSGCVVVEVPPSPRVPHMVDGRFPLRGETTRRFLSQSEVMLWARRASDAEEEVRRLLEEHVATDPYTQGDPGTAHLFGIAVPLSSRYDGLPSSDEAPGLLVDARNASARRWRERFGPADKRSRELLNTTPLSRANEAHPRSGEMAVRSRALHALATTGERDFDETDLAEWSVDEKGTVRIYDTGMAQRRFGRNGESIYGTWSAAPVEIAGILVESARLSAERIGYRGEWGIGLAGTGLRGVRLRAHEAFFYSRYPVVDRDGFSKVIIVSGHEFESDSGAVLDRLVRPLLRMLNDEDYLVP